MPDLSAFIRTHEDRWIDLRRHFHAHPELSNLEVATTAVLSEQMAAIGAKPLACPTPTGAAFVIDGGRPGKTVLLRADIDALPVEETRDLPFRSAVPGVMHACGHDAHTAGLIGTAAALADAADDLPGRYVLVFQPAEEALDGAKKMLEGGLLDGLEVDAALAWHAASIAPTGLVGLRNHTLMSRSQHVEIHAHGRGGHGALANSGGNVLLAVAELSQRLAASVEGLTYEGTDCVCSAGILRAGTAANVIPNSATLAGTLRTFTPDQFTLARERLETLVAEVAEAQGVEIELVLGEHADAVVNDPGVADVVRKVARSVLANESVLDVPPVAPSDDMSEFLKRIPGCYFFVGAGLADGSSGGHHEASFAIDDACIAIGASVIAEAAVALAT